MKILDNFILEDFSVYLIRQKTLIISDLHIGYEHYLNSQGIFLPKTNFNDLLLRLEKIIHKIAKNYTIEKIVINGDIKHEFGKISRDEKRDISRMFTFLRAKAALIIIKGNHDKILEYAIKEEGIILKKNVILGDILITHGDSIDKETVNKEIKTIIIGHEHPAIVLHSGIRSEKYKCFLVGKFAKKNLIVTPSAHLSAEGTDILRDKLLSPYLKEIKNFEVYILGDKIYDFGKIKNIIKIQKPIL